ncbi:MAG: hypothetical protein E5V21_19330 [Mesorhizobium sp.]|nr:MAG: hypothetical protein E5V21_19330 [Mesorhizobium sp.]
MVGVQEMILYLPADLLFKSTKSAEQWKAEAEMHEGRAEKLEDLGLGATAIGFAGGGATLGAAVACLLLLERDAARTARQKEEQARFQEEAQSRERAHEKRERAVKIERSLFERSLSDEASRGYWSDLADTDIGRQWTRDYTTSQDEFVRDLAESLD